jgi:hypothetical protein
MKRTTGLALVLVCALSPAVGAAERERCPEPLDACVAAKKKLFEKRGELGFLFSQAAGMRLGDFLLAMNGKDLGPLSVEQLLEMHRQVEPEQTVVYRIRRSGRGGEVVTVQVKAVKASPEAIDAWVGRHVREEHGEGDYREHLRRTRPIRRRSRAIPEDHDLPTPPSTGPWLSPRGPSRPPRGLQRPWLTWPPGGPRPVFQISTTLGDRQRSGEDFRPYLLPQPGILKEPMRVLKSKVPLLA